MIRAVFACAVVLGIGMSPAARAETPDVAADIAPVHALVARVMQGVGEPALILPQDASPHHHAMRPSEARALQEAELIVWMGPELAPWLEEALDAVAEDAARLTLMQVPGTQLLPWRDGVAFEIAGQMGHEGHEGHEHEDAHGHDAEHGHDDHAHDEDHGHEEDHGHDDHAHDKDHAHDAGHDHDKHAEEDDHGHGHDHGHAHDGANDTHAWLDPSNARVWLGAIAEELAQLDPVNAETYRANAAQGQAELAALEAELATALEAVRDLRFAVSHDAFQYFEARFGVFAVTAVTDGDAAPASAARLSDVGALIDERDVACVLVEPGVDTDRLANVFGAEQR